MEERRREEGGGWRGETAEVDYGFCVCNGNSTTSATRAVRHAFEVENNRIFNVSHEEQRRTRSRCKRRRSTHTQIHHQGWRYAQEPFSLLFSD